MVCTFCMGRFRTSIFFVSFESLFNVASVLNLSRIRFHICVPLQDIVSVCVFEDYSAWKFLRLYLFSLVRNKSLITGCVNMLSFYRFQLLVIQNFLMHIFLVVEPPSYRGSYKITVICLSVCQSVCQSVHP